MTAEGESLRGLQVLVTRPENQQQPLLEAITARGGKAVSCPLLAITPIKNEKAQQRLRAQIQNLDNYQLLIFISTNAAQFGSALIDDYWPQFPIGVEVFAVGPTTADAVRQQLPCEVMQSANGMDSEALLQLPALKNVAGKNIAIFRGVGGRELLAETLRSRGATVDYFEVYQREPVAYEPHYLVNVLQSEGVNVLSITSAESLRQLLALVDNKQALHLLPLLVPSQRIADLARDAGFQTVINTEGANTDAMIRGLQEITGEADT